MTTDPDTVTIPVIPVEQPIGQFYVGRIPAADLRLIAYADTRRQLNVETEVFAGIQRELNRKRREEIRKYIGSSDASFPNTFILAIRSEDVIAERTGELVIKKHGKVACIIDGQHRLSGFDEGNSSGFDLVVSIFIDIPLESQAMLFATINLKQTRVNESLVYDLFEETKERSPQKTAHEIAKSLNRDAESPFYRQIKPLGRRTHEYAGRISQATFVKRLLPLVCTNPDDVRDALLKNVRLDPADPEQRGCPFWRFFAMKQDHVIQKVITNYFAAVASLFHDEWGGGESALAKTIGFGALMKLLGPLGERGLERGELDRGYFEGELQRARTLRPFTLEKYPASGAGENKLAQALLEAVCP